MKIFKKIFMLVICYVLLCTSIPAYATTNSHAGLDVSVWQGNIDFEKVKSSGYDIVYIRAGYGLSEDSQFRNNAIKAKKSGMKVGYYFYVTATDTNSAKKQAEYFASIISKYDYNCKPAVDFESFNVLSKNEINNIAISFSETLSDKIGAEPIFYTDAYNAKTIWDKALTKYPLWIADYDSSEPYSIGPWSNWAGFQYSDKGNVNGISGNVDLDHFTDEIFVQKRPSTDTSDMPFTDVHKSNWFYNSVYNLYNAKLISGVTNTLFAPAMPSQRDMVVTLLYRIEGSPTVTSISSFSDVRAGYWYANSVTWANENNIARGYSNGLFYPSKYATREDVAVFLYRYANYKGYDVTALDTLSNYTDSSQIDEWAVPAMSWAVSSRIIQGTASSALSPQKDSSRAELAVMLERFLTKYSSI